MTKQHYRGRVERGRMWLIVIFVVLTAVNALLYLAGARFERNEMLGSSIVTFLWTTALLIGIWRRQNWCRYALVLILILGILAWIVLIPDVFTVIKVIPFLTALFVLQGLVNVVVAWALVASPDIRKLAAKT